MLSLQLNKGQEMSYEDLPNKWKQPKISEDPLAQTEMSTEQRLANIEHDIRLNSNLIYDMIKENESRMEYDEYLKAQTEKEKAQRAFWEKVRGQLVTAGILSTIGVLFSVIWFAITQYIEKIK